MISFNPQQPTLANTVSPFENQVSRPVGEANPEAQQSTIRPVEEANKSEKSLRRSQNDENSDNADAERDSEEQEKGDNPQGQKGADGEPLSREEMQLIQKLAARDREVKDHEQAHAAVGGELAGAPSYEYQKGPDGKNYAVGGEVPITIQEVAGDPKATLENARKVQRAALAPAEPSDQDRRVAARAAQLEQQALREISQLAEAQRQAREEEAEIRAEKAAQEREANDLRKEKQNLEEQRVSQAELNRKSVELTQTLVGIQNAGSNPNIGQLINRVS
ncbi:putative metalloprotease CJM1_0395 family protein [Pseudoteredinibacter isoporae]|uniref:putative metalloprotease CJM1_0395 family protein n=1 Tax=Pseudoteredinibacter isoporae TaxID=570281 RepID=UPI00310817F6